MGAAPAHGITMGYVSGPFRTEEQNPDTEGVAHSAHGGTMGRGQIPLKTSRGESSRRDASGTMAMGAVSFHGITMGYVSDPFRTEE